MRLKNIQRFLTFKATIPSFNICFFFVEANGKRRVNECQFCFKNEIESVLFKMLSSPVQYSGYEHKLLLLFLAINYN